MTATEHDILASRLATQIVAARVGAAAGRPNSAEGQDAAAYYRQVLGEVRRGLRLGPAESDDGATGA